MISVWLSFIAIVEFLNSRALRDNLPYIYGQFLGNLPLTTVVKPPPSPYFWQFCWGKISIFSRHRGQRDLKSNSRPLRQIESSRGKNVRSHFPNGFFFLYEHCINCECCPVPLRIFQWFLASQDTLEVIMSVSQSVSEWHCWTELTDVTLVSEDTYWGLNCCNFGDWWCL